jgi:hypothetical protein
MDRKELEGMLADIDAIGGYVDGQLAIMPTERSMKIQVVGRVAGVRSGLVKMIEAHDKSLESLKSRIGERRVS